MDTRVLLIASALAAAVWSGCAKGERTPGRDLETGPVQDLDTFGIPEAHSDAVPDRGPSEEPSDGPTDPGMGNGPGSETLHVESGEELSSSEEPDEGAGADSGGASRCGNGRLDPPEVCERFESRPCTEFGANFVSGDAWCRDDCMGWTFTACVTDGSVVCGNGKKESSAGWLEFCDVAAPPCPPAVESPLCFDGVKDCRDLGPGWTGGRSACSADCRTADVTDCTTAIPAYGRLEGSFETPFVLDESLIEVAGYLASHREALVPQPAFRGSYADDRPIPAEPPARTVSYALRSARRTSWGWYDQIYVVQESARTTPEGVAYQGAQLELRFRDGPLREGVEYPVNAGVMGANRLYLFHYTLPDGSGVPDGTHRCLMAVGIGGRVRITKAEGLYGADGGPLPQGGGRLAFVVEDVLLYWLGETPYGRDLSEDFEKPGGVNGVGMCERLP